MTYAIGKFTTKTEKEVHDDILRTVRNAEIAKGINANPQLGYGSDDDRWATALARETQPLYANTAIKADAQMPDTAAGDAPSGQNVGADLQRLMAIYGLAPRGATPSIGYITLSCSASTTIPAGAQLVDSTGNAYDVLSPGSYANGDLVQVESASTGPSTEHAAGDTLTWVAQPTYCAAKQPVATGGITGGKDAENNDQARARLYDRMRNPPGSGNTTQAIQYAEDSSPFVEKGFGYPALSGPSTTHVVVTAATSSTSKSRAIDATILSGTVVPYIAGKMPEYVEVMTTGTTDVGADVSIGITIPSAPNASPPGAGGGWVDGSPWPAISGVQTYANVTAVTSSTVFTVNAPTAPQANLSHVCMVDAVTWTLRRAKVLSYTGAAGAYVITIDTPWPNVVASGADIGTLVFPDAINMETYVDAFLAAFAALGPGEKSSNASALTRGFRHPPPQTSWPYSISSPMLKAIENTGDEVTDTSFYYRSSTTPAVPAAVTDPPNIFIPRRLGLYPI